MSVEEYKKKQKRLLEIKAVLMRQIQKGIQVEKNKKILELVNQQYLDYQEIINILEEKDVSERY